MHDTALELGRRFFMHYASGAEDPHILDLGSMDVNGSLRSVCSPAMRYTGVDMDAGPGVDLVLADPYVLPFDDCTFSAVVSSSCFEHSDMFWLVFLETLRVLRPGGYLYVNAPSNGWYHPYPRDCWRFYPDCGLSLVTWGRRQGMDVHLMESFVAPRSADGWNDMVLVFRKGAGTADAVPISSTLPGAGGVRAAPDIGVLQKPFDMTPDMQIINALLQTLKQKDEQIAALERMVNESHQAIAAYLAARPDQQNALTAEKNP